MPTRFTGLFLPAVIALITLCACSAPAGDSEEGDADEGALGARADVVFYPGDRTHSPMAPSVVGRLRELATPNHAPSAISKIGDSQTVSEAFLRCLARPGIDWGGGVEARAYDESLQAFLGQSQGARSFSRASLAAKIGASAGYALGGPLRAELDANRPRYAVVMFGSNDIQNAPTGGLDRFARDMLRITDALVADRVIPILSSPPPRPLRNADVSAFGPAGADVWVPRYGAVVRAIAQARQVPFVDLERELRRLPGLGIGGDRLHLDASSRGACKFDDEGLSHGMNVRNLVTFQALHRVRAALDGAEEVSDEGTLVAGRGTKDDPIVAPALPFSDLRSLEQGEAQAESCGDRSMTARFRYRFETEGRTLRIGVFGDGARSATLALRDVASGACRVLAQRDQTTDVGAGEHEIVVAAPAASAAEYLLTVTPE